jgi:hypothetical protein
MPGVTRDVIAESVSAAIVRLGWSRSPTSSIAVSLWTGAMGVGAAVAFGLQVAVEEQRSRMRTASAS